MLTEKSVHPKERSWTHDRQPPSVDYYILAACSYAARGIAALLRFGKNGCRIITPGNNEGGADGVGQMTNNSRVVVYFPDELMSMLTTLQELSLLYRLYPRPLPVLILSTTQPEWLYRTLCALIGRGHLLADTRITSSGSPLRVLAGMLNTWSQAPLLAAQGRAGIRGEGMTGRELDAVLSLLCGENITAQTRRLGLSASTLYFHRISGLRKLMAQFPHLINQLPQSRRPTKDGSKLDIAPLQLSPEEYAFEQAIHQGLVFPVFQPVTDRYFQVKGFEILIRWLRDGQEQQPADFLPKIEAPSVWLQLTAYVINEAVLQINRTGGAFYFAVNIPASVAESGALVRMMEIARQQLHDRMMADRLVLEFSESTDVNRGQARENIRQIQQVGHRILLDDCFSTSSVIFPVRQVQFSGYKLDMSIVNTFMHNHHDASLVQSLAGYCSLNGVECIAEGVDSWEKFVALSQAGVTGFQGYYLSKPVYRVSLDETVRLLQTRYNDVFRGPGMDGREKE